MIRYSCPTCGQKFENGDNGVGHKHNCPMCGQRLQVPSVNANKPQVVNKTILGNPTTAPPRIVPVLELADEEQNYRTPKRTGEPYPFRCPECGGRAKPKHVKKMSPLGWGLFAGLLTFCFPLCGLAFLCKDTWEVCSECHYRIRKVQRWTEII